MKSLALFLFLSFVTLNAVETKGYLTAEEIALFYQQGYLYKPQCLKAETMEKLSLEITGLIDRSLDMIQSSKNCTDQILYIDGSRIVYQSNPDQSVSIARINGCAGMQPSLLETIRSDLMVHTFFELLGTRDLEHLISQIHPKLPGDGIGYPRHRDIQFRKSFDPDWEDILGNGSYAICIIPIDPMTPENGGLWIDRNNYPEPKGEEEDLIWIYAEPGDLLFMHPHLYHGSAPNPSPTSSRKTLLTGFCAFGANHQTYPGAHVNTHLQLTENGEILITPAPWSQTNVNTPTVGH